jgi:hypothetical protein
MRTRLWCTLRAAQQATIVSAILSFPQHARQAPSAMRWAPPSCQIVWYALLDRTARLLASRHPNVLRAGTGVPLGPWSRPIVPSVTVASIASRDLSRPSAARQARTGQPLEHRVSQIALSVLLASFVAGQPQHPHRARQDRTGQTHQPCRRLTVSHVHMASIVLCSLWRQPIAPQAPTAMGLVRLRSLNAWPAWLASSALLPAQSLQHALLAPTGTPLGLQRKRTATFAPLEAIAHSSQSRPRSVLLAHTSTRREAPRRSVVCPATPGTTVLQAAFYPHSALPVRSEQHKGVPSCPRVTPVPQASTVP